MPPQPAAFQISNSDEESVDNAVPLQMGTYVIECDVVSNVIPRLVSIFFRHGIEIQNLSTWKSLTPQDAEGVMVTAHRPSVMSNEAVVKRINRLIGVVRVRWEEFYDSRRQMNVEIDISATGHYVDKLEILGKKFSALPLPSSRRCYVVRLSGSVDIVNKFLKLLDESIDPRMPGQVKVSTVRLARLP